MGCVKRLSQRYLTSPTEENLYHILALVKVGLVPVLRQPHNIITQYLAAYPNVSFPSPPSRDRHPGNLVTCAKQMVECGLIGKAERTLNNSSKVAPLTLETIASLEAKHPAGSHNPFSLPLHHSLPQPNIPQAEDIVAALDSFQPNTAPGPSGWSVRLTSIALVSPAFGPFIFSLTSGIALGDAPGAHLLCSARLTPLTKIPEGI